jgi:predicted flap endonuclease-1-like 5' DNA nuclease
MVRPLAKLPYVPPEIRRALKVQRINTCDQLLAAAAKVDDRATLALAARVDLDGLTELVCRADLARVRGTGFVFSHMLMQLGVTDVALLGEQDAVKLHGRLQQHNAATRTSRRSPTRAEVQEWVEQARNLPSLVTFASRRPLSLSKRIQTADAR